MNHTISIENFKDYKKEIKLASSTGTKTVRNKTFLLTIKIDGNGNILSQYSVRRRVSMCGDDEILYDSFEKAMWAYNGIF